MTFTKISLLCTLPLLALGAKIRRATPDAFGLYGYGDDIGGFPLFYADGYAQLGNPSQSNSTEATVVEFSPSGSDSSQAWIGNPNVTLTNSSVSWSNVMLVLPGASNSDKRVKLVSNGTADEDDISEGFFFYGATAMLLQDNEMESQWSVLEQNSTGNYVLYWNDTSLGQSPVIMRSMAPSNPSNRT